mmetsp:Transcript_21738/g.45349  ORF Transcript_21738/g.45349 Transcript_21738/m.45349 type:complete len:228 (+) Transcript_21738:601-1284(+)
MRIRSESSRESSWSSFMPVSSASSRNSRGLLMLTLPSREAVGFELAFCTSFSFSFSFSVATATPSDGLSARSFMVTYDPECVESLLVLGTPSPGAWGCWWPFCGCWALGGCFSSSSGGTTRTAPPPWLALSDPSWPLCVLLLMLSAPGFRDSAMLGIDQESSMVDSVPSSCPAMVLIIFSTNLILQCLSTSSPMVESSPSTVLGSFAQSSTVVLGGGGSMSGLSGCS